MSDDIDLQPTPKKKSWGKPFVKGDPRASKGGKAPRNFAKLRTLARKLASECIATDGSVDTTKVEAIILDWLDSTDFNKQKAALELAYGKVPDKIEHTGENGGAIEVTFVKRDAA